MNHTPPPPGNVNPRLLIIAGLFVLVGLTSGVLVSQNQGQASPLTPDESPTILAAVGGEEVLPTTEPSPTDTSTSTSNPTASATTSATPSATASAANSTVPTASASANASSATSQPATSASNQPTTNNQAGNQAGTATNPSTTTNNGTVIIDPTKPVTRTPLNNGTASSTSNTSRNGATAQPPTTTSAGLAVTDFISIHQSLTLDRQNAGVVLAALAGPVVAGGLSEEALVKFIEAAVAVPAPPCHDNSVGCNIRLIWFNLKQTGKLY